jgi:CHAD domain-containing protein
MAADSKSPSVLRPKGVRQSALVWEGGEPAADEWAVVRHVALRHLDRFVSLHPKALVGDDPEAIHDIRVASRRVQQVLDLLYPQPQPKSVRRLRRRIRRCRRALSEVRNCDVLLERVERRLRRKRVARRRAWEAVRDHLVEERAAVFEEAVERLARLKLGAVYLGLKEAIESGPPAVGTDAASRQPTAFATRAVESLQEVWHGFETQVLESHRQPEPQKLHGVRIAAKRLRYLVEVLAELEAEGSAAALDWLKRLQEHLGDWHDLEILEQAMTRTVARPRFIRRNLEQAIEIEKLIARHRQQKRAYEEKYFRMTMNAEEWKTLSEWVRRTLASPETITARA